MVTTRIFGPIDTRQDNVVRPVRSRDEWKRTMTSILKRPGSARGTTVLLTRGFTVSDPLVIPDGCDGLVVRAASRFDMRPNGRVTALFHVLSEDVTIDSVRAVSDATDYVGLARGTNYFEKFATGTGNLANTLTCLFCYAAADAFIDGTDFINNALTMIGCDLLSTDPATATTAITLAGGGGDTIAFCRLVGGSGTSIVSTSNASASKIVGNTVAGDIDTSGSFVGFSRLAANYTSGTKTLHADDIDLDAREAVALLSATTTVNVSSATAPSSGQVLTATSSTAATWQTPSSGWTTVTKTTNQTKNSDTTYADDTELKFTMAASTKYRIRIRAFCEMTGNSRIKFQIQGPAAPTLLISKSEKMSNNTASTDQVTTAYAQSTSIAPAAGTWQGTIVYDVVVHNAGTSGTFALQWAQNSLHADATTVFAGSYLEYAVVA